jgi:hypothetical protein
VSAPERFASWMSIYEFRDKFSHTYRYHPRSDVHSEMLCMLVLEDLMERCPVLREQASHDLVAYGINARHEWPNGKKKTIDLAVGRPIKREAQRSLDLGIGRAKSFSDVFLSCEAKSAMTEHGKAQPRIFDELSSSHEIVHKGRPDAIAAGIAVVNIAGSFVSPTRNQSVGALSVTTHRQPHVAERMVRHLRGLPIRDDVMEVGFDAYSTIVVDCDNQGPCALWTAAPAPQSGERDHYQTFIERLARFYTERFRNLE